MLKFALWILLAAAILHGILWMLDPGREYHDQVCTRCGLERHVVMYICGPFEQEESCRERNTVLSTYYDEFHVPCASSHSWRNYHGGGGRMFTRFTYCGDVPLRKFVYEDALMALHGMDQRLLDEIVRHIIDLNNTSYSDKKDALEAFERGMIAFRDGTTLEQYLEWWSAYRTRYRSYCR